jgi:hypothetical protein
MKEHGRPSDESEAGSGGLAREEWDFGKCAAGRERHCFSYEYAREAAWIIDEYRLAKRCGRKVKPGWRPGFDDFGNWHFWRHGDGERGDDWCIYLQVPPGFPEVPYLETAHRVYTLPSPGVVADPPFLEAEEWKKQGFGDEGSWTRVRLNWDHPDKTMVREFQAWLRRNRPKAARERWGNPATRRYLADLMALGAYRLMVKGGMTADEAQAYTKQHKRYGLYAKIPDWYEAKSRALWVLEEYFRYQQESIAGLVLADNACETCPEKGDGCEPK